LTGRRERCLGKKSACRLSLRPEGLSEDEWWIMGLYFENATPSTVWVVYGHPSTTPWCDAGWYKTGWYEIAPESTVKVWSGWIGGHSFEYYAEDDFGHVWAGEDLTFVPWDTFYLCWEDQMFPGKTQGLRWFYVGGVYVDYTKRLVL
jgi:hypothetical protein